MLISILSHIQIFNMKNGFICHKIQDGRHFTHEKVIKVNEIPLLWEINSYMTIKRYFYISILSHIKILI